MHCSIVSSSPVTLWVEEEGDGGGEGPGFSSTSPSAHKSLFHRALPSPGSRKGTTRCLVRLLVGEEVLVDVVDLVGDDEVADVVGGGVELV